MCEMLFYHFPHAADATDVTCSTKVSPAVAIAKTSSLSQEFADGTAEPAATARRVIQPDVAARAARYVDVSHA
jgi:hypothetical protein